VLFVFHEVLLDTVDGSLNHVSGEIKVDDSANSSYRPAPVVWESDANGTTWIWGKYQDSEVGVRARNIQDDTTILVDVLHGGNISRDLTPGTTALKFVFGDPQTDGQGPVTSIALSGPQGDNGWFVGDVTATITATDLPDPGWSGVTAIYYRVDAGIPQIRPVTPAAQTATTAVPLTQEGSHTVQAWAADVAGNAGAKAAASVKLDGRPPQTLIRPDRAPDEEGTYTGPVTVTLEASDATSGVAWTKYSLDGGDTWLPYSGPLTLNRSGTFAVQAMSRDQAGNQEDPPAALVLELVLNRPPVADAGADRTVEATGGGGASVTLDGSGSSDPDGDQLAYHWSWPGASGKARQAAAVNPTVFLSLGGTVVTLVVSDGQVDSSPDTVRITVADTTAPTVTGLTATPARLWPPNGKLCDVTLTYAATDAADPSPRVAVTVTGNEPSFTASDAQVVDPHHLKLRATRDGQSKAGRIYTITVRATDAAGNTGEAHTTVTVPHDQR
jgi:hypothetical protein